MSFLNDVIERSQAACQMPVNLGICEVCLLISSLTDWGFFGEMIQSEGINF